MLTDMHNAEYRMHALCGTWRCGTWTGQHTLSTCKPHNTGAFQARWLRLVILCDALNLRLPCAAACPVQQICPYG
jgi:hypothetical protein